MARPTIGKEMELKQTGTGTKACPFLRRIEYQQNIPCGNVFSKGIICLNDVVYDSPIAGGFQSTWMSEPKKLGLALWLADTPTTALGGR